MKLSEFIYEKFALYNRIDLSFDESDVEKWIVTWYNASFKEVGCTSPTANSRQPPSWLADWRIHNE